MNLSKESVIGEVVAENYKAATVFKSHKIDFCCNGGRTIAEACEKQNINTDELLQQINQVLNEKSSETIDFKSWSLDLLVDYIEKKHHRYVRQRINDILPFLIKVTRVHGENHPELYEINQLFSDSADALLHHLEKEENILFPFIKEMSEAESRGEKLKLPFFGTVNNPIQMMHEEHDDEGERFRKIATLSNDYTPPENACNTYRVTFALLQEFEEDLHQHIHIENNIIFPRAIQLEQLIVEK